MAGNRQSAHPAYTYPDYKSSALRGPGREPVDLGEPGAKQSSGAGLESRASLAGRFKAGELDHDLTRSARRGGEPLGERIAVSGRVLDERGNPVRGALIEVWQANAAGRYRHKADDHDAPVDPNFHGAGRCVTDGEGRYRFLTIQPGAYPWQNHHNAWRPRHIHFSVIGDSPISRLVTQMYFPGDPLLDLDPIFQAVPAAARGRLIAHFDLGLTQPEFALGYHFDIVVAGSGATPRDDHGSSAR